MLNINSFSPLLIVHRRLVRLLNNAFEISVVGHSTTWCDEMIDIAAAEIDRVLNLLLPDEGTQIALINRNAGIKPVKVDAEVFSLIKRSLKISDLTQGTFDITYKSIDVNFRNKHRAMTSLPDVETAKNAVRLIDYRNVILDSNENTVFLKEKGMRIDLSRIAKAYATDRAKYVLQIHGVVSGIVNAFGDLITWGMQPDNKPWTIEDADPDQILKGFSGLNISNMALSTSGNQQAYSVIDGKKYMHTFNPKTGLPLRSINSVSVMSPSAELAAAMSAPVMVMGVKLSLSLFNQLNQLVCVIVNDRKRVYTSKNINMMMC